MDTAGWKRAAAAVAAFVGVWLGLRYLFPIILPFLLGWCLAALAEPGTKFLQKKLHFRRNAASFLSLTVTLVGSVGALGLLVALSCREAVAMAGGLSKVAAQVTAGIDSVQNWAVNLASKAPEGLSEPLTRTVDNFFSGGSGILERGAGALLDLAGHTAEGLPRGLLLLGTAVISGYLISARLPVLGRRLTEHPAWNRRWRPVLLRLRSAAGCWLRAQVKLSGVTFAIVLAGFWLLRVDNVLAMAVLTALVDAVPLLGTGTVLLPWALVCLLSHEPVRAVGLLGVYVTALVVRSSLEPRLVGRQLGLDPLVALMALYAGFQIWGFAGMIVAPILTVTVRELCRGNNGDEGLCAES